MKTKNKYHLPVKKEDFSKIDRTSSPAHIGKLKNSVDFICKEGTPIKASLSGVVVDVKQDSDIGGEYKSYDKSGNYIEIKHENEEFSIYEHIRKGGALVKVGDKVKTGQVIGYSGATGWLAHLGPHLHFDVHKYHKPFGAEDYETLEVKFKEGKI